MSFPKPTLYVASTNKSKKEAVVRILPNLLVEFESDVIELKTTGWIKQPIGIHEAVQCLSQRIVLALKKMDKFGVCIAIENYVEHLQDGGPTDWGKQRLMDYANEDNGWVDRCVVAICYKTPYVSGSVTYMIPSELVVPVPSSQLRELYARNQTQAIGRVDLPTVGELLKAEHGDAVDAADWFKLVPSCDFTRCDQIVNALELNLKRINNILVACQFDTETTPQIE